MCADRSWVMPAHDASLSNFKGTHLTIDLGSSARAWLLATTDWWLGERLQPEIRDTMRREVRKRFEDAGLTVASAIGFAQWSVDDEAQRLRRLSGKQATFGGLLRRIRFADGRTPDGPVAALARKHAAAEPSQTHDRV